ncbi:MAG: HAD-IA family hydrolase [Spirochaetota bacterium]
MSPIKAVAFDFGNLLCKLDRPACNAALAAHSPLSPDEVGEAIWGGDIEIRAETGRLDSQGHFLAVKAAIRAEEAWSYDEFQAEYMSALLPHPAGEDAMILARDLGLRIFIVSNTSFLHSRFIFGREVLATLPELYALSYKVGAMKPDSRMWTWILERSGLEAKECLFFDDVAAYVEAAAALGFRAARHDPVSGILSRELGEQLY